MKHLDSARLLADILDEHGFAAEELLSLNEHVWQLAVSLAELQTGRKLERPTDAVKTLVYERLRERARLEHTHPLEGLPR